MKDVMTPQEVADVLGLSRDTVMRYIACGRIKGSAISGTVRKRYVVTKESLKEYLSENVVKLDAIETATEPRVIRSPCPILERYGYTRADS